MDAVDGQKVSREDLFRPDIDVIVQDVPQIDMQFDVVDVADNADVASESPVLDGFQLFGGVTVSADVADHDEPEEHPVVVRPIEAFMYTSTPALAARCRSVAVTGDEILSGIVVRESKLEDVNKQWKSPKRRCRLGKKARQRRIERRVAAETRAREEAAAARYASRRRHY